MAKTVPEHDVEVLAISTGYVASILRPAGSRFMWPAGIPLGSWVEPAAFGGKGDHDGDGVTGGSVPAEEAGGKKGKKKGKAETVQQPDIEPFGDAPAPTEVKGNGIKEALGVEPDWLPPGANGEQAEMADE